MRMKLAGPQRSPSVRFPKAVAIACVLSVAIGCALCRSAAADSRTGRIHLSVIDEKNQPVPDATVEFRLGDKLAAASRTDTSGNATLTVDIPGTYRLGIRKQGYLTSETTLKVSEGSAAQDVDVVLTTLALSKQSVDVTGDLGGCPAADPWNRARSGRERTIAGFGEDHSALLVNSVDVTDPATGGFGLSVPIDSVQTIEVSEMPYLAEYGRFTAGVVAADTRRGGEKWGYSLNDPLPDFFIRSGHLDGCGTPLPDSI
jgi:hypothetical protein